MPIIPPEKLAYIIKKTRELDVEMPPVNEDSGSNPPDDAERDVLEDSADNKTYQEPVDAINSLSDLERSSCWRSFGSAAVTTARRNGARRSKKPAASSMKKSRIA